jgi:hypothetical protein
MTGRLLGNDFDEAAYDAASPLDRLVHRVMALARRSRGGYAVVSTSLGEDGVLCVTVRDQRAADAVRRETRGEAVRVEVG